MRELDLSKFEIELILSGNTAKLLRMKPVERASVEPVHFLACWRVELAEDGHGGKWFLITNAITMYSILIPHGRDVGFDELVQQFVMRLRFTLLGARPPISWEPAAVRAVRGGSAPLIGTMNNMVYLLSARLSRHSKSEEEILNDTPFFAIPEIFPAKAFFGRLDQPTT